MINISKTFSYDIFNESDNHYNGWYEHDNGKITGSFEHDYYLTGIWSEEPTYQPYNDAGEFMLEFKSQNNQIIFNGKWGYGNDPMLYDWIGEKVGDINLHCK
ncbi:MAG: hypothetical protein ACERKZ_04770 [Lachnotalea sp.]